MHLSFPTHPALPRCGKTAFHEATRLRDGATSWLSASNVGLGKIPQNTTRSRTFNALIVRHASARAPSCQACLSLEFSRAANYHCFAAARRGCRRIEVLAVLGSGCRAVSSCTFTLARSGGEPQRWADDMGRLCGPQYTQEMPSAPGLRRHALEVRALRQRPTCGRRG